MTENGRISLAQVVRDELHQFEGRWKEWRGAHWKEHEKLDERLMEMEKLVPAIRAIMWVGAALGVSIVGLIWALITGQVQLIFQ